MHKSIKNVLVFYGKFINKEHFFVNWIYHWVFICLFVRTAAFPKEDVLENWCSWRIVRRTRWKTNLLTCSTILVSNLINFQASTVRCYSFVQQSFSGKLIGFERTTSNLIAVHWTSRLKRKRRIAPWFKLIFKIRIISKLGINRVKYLIDNGLYGQQVLIMNYFCLNNILTKFKDPIAYKFHPMNGQITWQQINKKNPHRLLNHTSKHAHSTK